MLVIDENLKNLSTHRKNNKSLFLGNEKIGSISVSKPRLVMTLVPERMEKP